MLTRNGRLELDGAHNFRDLGGITTTDGRLVRAGTVFRADAPHALSWDDLERCGALGLRTVFDLRSPLEREAEPSRLSLLPGVWVLETPLLTATAPTLAPAQDGEAFLLAVYGQLLTESAATIGEVLSLLAEPGAMPAVFHCSAGKDRTGVLAAVLLLAIGVGEVEVLDDYELTARYRSAAREQEILHRLGATGMPIELAAGLMGTPRWVMRRALQDSLGDDTGSLRYGSVLDYLRGPAGMTDRTIARLRIGLTTDT